VGEAALLADRAEAAWARPYDLGEYTVILGEALSPKALLAWQWVLAAERGFGGHEGGLRIRHADWARLLSCSQRAAADAVRELVAFGLVEVRHRFRSLTDAERTPRTREDVLGGVRKHQELRPTYVTTARGQEVIAGCRMNQVGRKRQPGGAKRTLRVLRKCGAPGRGRPARRFAQAVRTKLYGDRTPRETARVIERHPDGRVSLGSPLTAAAVAQRLGRERPDEPRARVDDDPIARAWRSFEERHGA
jgi:hypothetical protein